MNRKLLRTRFLPVLTVVALATWCGVSLVFPQERQPPVSFEQLLSWMGTAEANQPSEEIIDRMRSFAVGFEMTPTAESEIRNCSEAAGRPPDLVRQIVQAARENWIFDRIRLLVKRPEGLDQIAGMVRDSGVDLPYSPDYEKMLRDAGAEEPVLTLLWPPLAPQKPRFHFQEWRVPRRNVEPLPLRYDPFAARGEVQMDVVVDGRVMFVLKHNTFFYNVICGNDLDVQRVHFTGQLPHLSPARWEYRVDTSRRKPRGSVFACPLDPKCVEASADKRKNRPEALCTWEDLPDVIDDHGFSNARFVIDDHQSGAGLYSVDFQWAVKPYTAEWLASDIRKYGPQEVLQRMYDWGVSFGLDPQTRTLLTEAGANQGIFDGIGRVYRRSNVIALKIH